MVIKEAQGLSEIRKDYTAEALADYLINSAIYASTRMKTGLTRQPMDLFMRTAFVFLKG